MSEGKAPLSVEEIPRFEFNLNDQQLQSYLKELAFNQSAQKKELDKLRKEIEKKPAEFAITEAYTLSSSDIDVDSQLFKEMKGKDAKPSEETNPIRKSAKEFGKKLGTMSYSINTLLQMIKGLDKRIKIVEIEHPTETQNKTKYLQGRIQQVQQLLSLDLSNLTQQVQESTHESLENIKQTQKKTLWQITDCRKALQTRITQQYVKDSMVQLEQKIANRTKQQQSKLNFDPDKMIRLDSKMAKMEHDFSMHTIEVEQHFKAVSERMVSNLVSKHEHSEDKIKTEKRLTLMNNNVSEINKKMIFMEEDKGKISTSIRDLTTVTADSSKEITRMSEALKSMKLSGEFIQMLEKINPHKICEMDNSIEALKVENNRVMRELEATRKQVEKIRMKNTYLETLQPDQFSHMKVKREEVEKIVAECLASNDYLKKIQAVELKFADIDNCNLQVSNLDRKVNKLSKENDLHNVIFQLKGLEEYLKREVLMLQNRLTQFEISTAERRSSRATSASKVTFSHSNSTINVKKLYPINCISHYKTSELMNTDGFASDLQMRSGRASSMRKKKEI